MNNTNPGEQTDALEVVPLHRAGAGVAAHHLPLVAAPAKAEVLLQRGRRDDRHMDSAAGAFVACATADANHTSTTGNKWMVNSRAACGVGRNIVRSLHTADCRHIDMRVTKQTGGGIWRCERGPVAILRIELLIREQQTE